MISALKWVLTLVLVANLIFPMNIGYTGSLTIPSNPEDKATRSPLSGTEGKTIHEVALITGDTVIVTEYPDGRRGIAIKSVDTRRNFFSFNRGNHTYVVPADVDLKRLDIELFNIDYMIDQGYSDQPLLPLIVRCKSREAVQAASGGTEIRSFVTRVFSLIPAFAAHPETKRLKEFYRALVSKPDVERISLDRKVHADLNQSSPLVGAPEVWSSGYNGTGIVIAILDTGIDSTHPDFYLPDGTCKIVDKVSYVTDPYTEDPEPDYMGHGTHCASIAAGTGLSSPVVSNWLSQPVTLDGAITSSSEWSDAIERDLVLLAKPRPDIPGPQTALPARCWIKNDGDWLYILMRAEWLPINVDPNDGAFINYFWGEYLPPWEHSDGSFVSYGSATFDSYGWDDVQWYDDVAAGGQNNVEGAATYDGAHYWFEFRKMLNSGDGYDWSLTPGQIVEGHLLIGIYDHSEDKGYESYISLKLCSQSVTYDDYRFTGVAPGALLWNVKVLNQFGWGYWSWIISGIEYAAYGPDRAPGTGDEADIISMSLGGWPTDGTDPPSLAVDEAVDNGVTVCVAAGNDGDYFWINSPGAARKAITVGASDKYDELAWFSSRGPTLDFRVKPDILAPGVGIIAARAWDSWFSSIPEHVRYCQLSGTSMATPHVAGASSLIIQANPTLPTQFVKDALINTAVDLGYNVYEQGGGRMNVTAAALTSTLMTPATYSFGVFTVDSSYFADFTFYNLGASPVSIALSVTLIDVVTGETVYGKASLNTTTLNVPAGSQSGVRLMVDTSVPVSLYSGRIEAIDLGNQEAIHTIFGFARLNELTVTKYDLHGSPATDDWVMIFKTDPTSYLDSLLSYRWGYIGVDGRFTTYVGSGTLKIVSYGYSDEGNDIWTMDTLVATVGSYNVILDERDANPITFNTNKPDQVLCMKKLSLSLDYPSGVWGTFWSVQSYPINSTNLVSDTDWNATFGYAYYPLSDYNFGNPYHINTDEWHNLLYSSLGVAAPLNLQANYLTLVEKRTEYRLALTPKVSAWLFIWTYTRAFTQLSDFTYAWGMTLPCSRTEYVCADVEYVGFIEKWSDFPGIVTPYWLYHTDWTSNTSWTEGARVSDIWGGHPLSSQVSAYYDSGYDRIELMGHFFQDSYGHSLCRGRVTVGNVTVLHDGYEDARVWDCADFWWTGFQPAPASATYTVILKTYPMDAYQYLSTRSYVIMKFRVQDESGWYLPPLVYFRVPELDMYNRHAPGVVEVGFIVLAQNTVSSATTEYSLNDGASWILAPSSRDGNSFRASLGSLQNTYVSLRVNATDVEGNSISQTTIRAFYVERALTTFGSAIRISYNAYASYVPSVATSGSYVYMAWQDNTPVSGSGGQPEIWMRISSNNGASFGSPIRISYNAYPSIDPSVAASGSYIYVAWMDYTPVFGSGGQPEIWMRISSNYGASFGPAVRISYNVYASIDPSVAASGSYVYVAWADSTPVSGSGGLPEIWLRVSSNNGASFGSAIRISTNTYMSYDPSVAAYGSYVYVAWEDWTPVSGSGGWPEIWLRASSNHGASFGYPIRLTTNAGESIYPSVAVSGSYVYVAWQDNTPISGSGVDPEIWMRISSNNGASFGSPIRISYNAYDSMFPSVAASGSYVYVAWEDNTPVSGSGGSLEIWMRVSLNNGASFGSAVRITTNAGSSDNPSVAAYGSYVYVAWHDYTPVSGSGTAPEIWLRVGKTS